MEQRLVLSGLLTIICSGSVIEVVTASHTGYGDGVIQLKADSLSCSFQQAYYGAYYFSGFKATDSVLEACFSVCLSRLSVQHSPFELDFEPIAPAPAPTDILNPYDSIQVYDENDLFICNCPKGSGNSDDDSALNTWMMDSAGHVHHAWGAFSWDSHNSYSVSNDTGAPISGGSNNLGTWDFTLSETQRHPTTVHFEMMMPRTSFCSSGCEYWDKFSCAADYELFSGDAFQLEANIVARSAPAQGLILIWHIFLLTQVLHLVYL
jgi:hypothetical protein